MRISDWRSDVCSSDLEKLTPQQERYYQAAEWRIVWWRFRRHRVAVWSGAFLLAMYLAIVIAEFLAPYELHTRNIQHIYAPPQALHLFHEGEFIGPRSEEHTSELQSLMRISYAVFRLKKTKQ